MYRLGEFANGRRRRPLFPPSMWNVNERVLGSHDRTNNFVEALHRKCQRQLAVQHPGLWRFIDSIAALQRTLELDYEQWVRGDEREKSKTAYLRMDAKIKKIVQEANTRTHMEFLRGCASNFDLE